MDRVDHRNEKPQHTLREIDALCEESGPLAEKDVIAAAHATRALTGRLIDHIRRHADALHSLILHLSRMVALAGDEPSQLGGGEKLQQAAEELRRALNQASDLVRRNPSSLAEMKAVERELP